MVFLEKKKATHRLTFHFAPPRPTLRSQRYLTWLRPLRMCEKLITQIECMTKKIWENEESKKYLSPFFCPICSQKKVGGCQNVGT